MRLLIQRKPSSNVCTIGDLFIDGHFQCHTLEDVDREIIGEPVSKWKVAGKTAIPKGAYSVIVNQSARFKRLLPLVQNVPGFEGIRIHPGNTDADTEGCILPGTWAGGDSVHSSGNAFAMLIAKLNIAIKANDPIYLEIRRANGAGYERI